MSKGSFRSSEFSYLVHGLLLLLLLSLSVSLSFSLSSALWSIIKEVYLPPSLQYYHTSFSIVPKFIRYFVFISLVTNVFTSFQIEQDDSRY
jgi:hypothetical protein